MPGNVTKLIFGKNSFVTNKELATVSIITINYNNYEGLKKTMSSVFSQTFKDFEYIVIDGGSSDRSKTLLTEYCNKIDYYISEKDSGIFDAMNKGIKRATGEYLMFLNSGDYLIDQNILQDTNRFLFTKESDIIYGNIEVSNEQNVISVISYPDILSLNFWETCTINHQSSFIKASLFKEFGLYETNYKNAADYVFFLKSFISNKRFFHIDQALVNYGLDGNSNLNRSEYEKEMNLAWKNNVPDHLNVLYMEHKEFSLLMKHRIMKLAKNFNNSYTRFKRLWK